LENEGPNGNFRPGRNESRTLRNGTRHMIPGPCSFYLRPGQEVEVRDAHELASNQYLVVKVYGEVDHSAPYYEITARSAAITAATAEDATGAAAKVKLEEREAVGMTRGQLIVIRGLDTQLYIPPTGVDVVPDLSLGSDGNTLTVESARKILQGRPQIMASTPPLPPRAEIAEAQEELQDYEDERDEEAYDRPRRREAPQRKADRFAGVEQAARVRQVVQRPPPPPALSASPTGMTPQAQAEPVLSDDDLQSLLQSDVHRQALERHVRQARLVRQAVVLGEKEFCVVIDADGKRQIKVGPARVFPGPYDSFMTKGSNHRIYFAYELLPQRALWLRFISAISRDKLERKLPRGVELDREVYYPGDEMIITGINTFFFPFIEAEILHPLTGQPHFGNDHADVFIEAIGIDQKSGIYVRDLMTGEARLVRGKQSYLVDPRKEVHITRTIPPDEWNLWIGVNESHKATHAPVTTPWAISINVPHNTAVLVSSAEGHRVVEGPCVELLEYDERLVPLSLSRGTPKSDKNPLRTCYLRTVGNVVSDVIRLQTSDFVEVDIRVSYRISMDQEHKTRWFNHEDYVGMVCDHLRSLVRRSCRQTNLTDLWPRIPDVVRDIILGERTESGRRGRLFAENGLWVSEVEVLDSSILDDEVGDFLETVQRESVSIQISDRQAAEKLRSDKLRHDFDLQRLVMRKEAQEKQAENDAALRDLEHRAQMVVANHQEEVARTLATLGAEREALALTARLARLEQENHSNAQRLAEKQRATVEAERLAHEEEQAHRRALAEIEQALVAAHANATVAERQAVQPALIEALTALGDKEILSQVAANMNLVSLFKGKDVASLFADIVGGTKLKRTITTMLPEPSPDDTP